MGNRKSPYQKSFFGFLRKISDDRKNHDEDQRTATPDLSILMEPSADSPPSTFECWQSENTPCYESPIIYDRRSFDRWSFDANGLREENQSVLSDNEAQWKKILDDYKNQISLLKVDKAWELADVRRKAENERRALEVHCARVREDDVMKMEQVILAMRKEYEQELKAEKEKHDRDLEAEKEKHERELEAENEKHEKDLKAMREKYEWNLDATKEQYMQLAGDYVIMKDRETDSLKHILSMEPGTFENPRVPPPLPYGNEAEKVEDMKAVIRGFTNRGYPVAEDCS